MGFIRAENNATIYESLSVWVNNIVLSKVIKIIFTEQLF